MRSIVVLILLFCAGVLFFTYRISSPVALKESIMRFEIASDANSSRVSDELSIRGFFGSKIDFSLMQWIIGGKIKGGVYYFTQGMSEYDIYRMIITGPVRQEKTITIIEGWTLQQIAEYLSSQEIESASTFLDETRKDWSNSYSFLSGEKRILSLEGYLFPDTYNVFENSSSREIIVKMLSNFDRKFSEQMRRDARNKNFTIHEIVTLASIIEREVASDQDRSLVSDIFHRRLKKGMALQADSTVNYVTKKHAPQASLSDIITDSPYNTYKYRGLPPGPIGNPSLSSLRAALYPTQNSYYYFLTSPDGRVHYSETFEEHKKKKRKYL